MSIAVRCDRCGYLSPKEQTRERIQADGWRVVNIRQLGTMSPGYNTNFSVGDSDICPKCMLALGYFLDPGIPDSISVENP